MNKQVKNWGNSTKILIGEQHQNNWEIACEWKKQTLVLVSQRTSSCLTRKERAPATRLPKHHGTQWQPGSRTSSYFPKTSLMAKLDWSTCTQPNTCPIFSIKPPQQIKTPKQHTNITIIHQLIMLNAQKNNNNNNKNMIFFVARKKIKKSYLAFDFERKRTHLDNENLNLIIAKRVSMKIEKKRWW